MTNHQSADLNLLELVRACALARLDSCNQCLRKWTEAFGAESAWGIKSEQLEVAAQAMVEAGYKSSSVNRDLSSLGTVYRWAKERRLSPRGFRSPTLEARRFTADIRRVEVSTNESVATALRAFRDAHGSRIASVVHLAAYFDFTGEENPLYQSVNVDGTRPLLHALQGFEVGQFLYPSTMLVHAPCRPASTSTRRSSWHRPGPIRSRRPPPRRWCAKSAGTSPVSSSAWRVCMTHRLWCLRWRSRWPASTSATCKASGATNYRDPSVR